MPKPLCSNEEFIRIWHDNGCSPALVANALGTAVVNVHKRRKRMADSGIARLSTVHKNGLPSKYSINIPENKVRTTVNLQNGVIVVGSDAHYWPGIIDAGHKAFVAVIAAIKPDIVIMNGDAFDGAKVSRHARIGWDKRPTVKQEIEAVSDRLEEIVKAHSAAAHLWNMGNHDFRFDTYLATNAADFEDVAGFTLAEQFPQWKIGMSVMVNDSCQIKHRQHNGIHAVYNNTLKSGVTMVTGHLHSLKVTPWTDLTGTRYGVDTGCLADPWGPQFDYQEDGARNHRSGFAVLTFAEGKLMPPELCEVVDDSRAWFRGQLFDLTK